MDVKNVNESTTGKDIFVQNRKLKIKKHLAPDFDEKIYISQLNVLKSSKARIHLSYLNYTSCISQQSFKCYRELFHLVLKPAIMLELGILNLMTKQSVVRYSVLYALFSVVFIFHHLFKFKIQRNEGCNYGN